LKTTLLHEETDAAWVDIDQSFPLWVKDYSIKEQSKKEAGFFWITERNGAPEIEFRSTSGTLLNSVVPPSAGFAEFVGYDEEQKYFYFTGGINPTESSVFSVSQDGIVNRLTPAGTVEEAVLTGGNKVLSVKRTSEKMMPQSLLLRFNGTEITTIPSVAKDPSLKLNIEFLELKSGVKSHAAIVRPNNFVKGKKYPVILQVYGGPRHQEVLKTLRENLILQWMAEQQFIIVKLDGRGTPRRGRDFERAIKNDFATLICEDQLAGLKELGAKYTELDLKRVGSFGWSFGGYLSALLALKHSEIIKSAVSGAPVVDWMDYDTHYTERFLGVPPAGAKAYEVSSLLTYVDKTESPILLMHGTADDNVYFLHSLKLSDAMFKAGKKHSVLPLSNFTHMVPDPLVMQRQYETIAQWFHDTL
jgi:dipeptidyl-peptidase 4